VRGASRRFRIPASGDFAALRNLKGVTPPFEKLYAKDGLLGKTASWTKDEYGSRASLFGTESAVACVADQPPGAASLDWLQHAGYKVHGPNFDARETLFAEFNGIYSAVRFYDGTRVEDPALFSVTGLDYGSETPLRELVSPPSLLSYVPLRSGRMLVCLSPDPGKV
jgi:hypothetical protein